MTYGDWQESTQNPPPTEFTALPDKPSSWPTVIGVIGAILASLGLICGCAGYFQVPIQRWSVDMQAQGGQANPVAEVQLRAAEHLMIPTMVLLTIGLLGSIWLLVASISLLRRRAMARKHFIGVSMLSLLLLALNVALQIIAIQSMVEMLTEQGEGDRMMEIYAGAAIGGCFMLVFGIAWPVFILIWFSRAKIKAEMEQWPR